MYRVSLILTVLSVTGCLLSLQPLESRTETGTQVDHNIAAIPSIGQVWHLQLGPLIDSQHLMTLGYPSLLSLLTLQGQPCLCLQS